MAGWRITEVKHKWQDWNDINSVYDTVYAINKTTAAYDVDNGVKVSTSFFDGVGTSFVLQRTENYGYDPTTGWLTGVDYNDGLPNEVTTWAYDVAGNRISDSSNPGTWTYDNLNRMTVSPGATYSHDILGNRTARTMSGTGTSYGWDDLNRMTTFRPDISLSNSYYYAYQYRADGLRTMKVDSWNDPSTPVTTKYYYIGMMGIQDSESDGTSTTVTKYGVGARGIEMISKIVNSNTESFGFPLYDTHGNMLATLARDGAGYTVGNVRAYDVWGSVRSGWSTEDMGFSSELGHRLDEESGLLYMRARYYDQETGRFITEDPSRHGSNWYVYANNAPTINVDPKGESALIYVGAVLLFLAWVVSELPQDSPIQKAVKKSAEQLLISITAITAIIALGSKGSPFVRAASRGLALGVGMISFVTAALQAVTAMSLNEETSDYALDMAGEGILGSLKRMSQDYYEWKYRVGPYEE